jgi:hypothetical protein
MVKYGLHGINHIGSGKAMVWFKTKIFVAGQENFKLPAQAGLRITQQGQMNKIAHGNTRCIRQRMIVCYVGLLNGILFKQPFTGQGTQGYRQHPHAGPVSGVPLVKGRLQNSFEHIVSDPPTAGVPHINGLGTKPGGKGFCNSLQ